MRELLQQALDALEKITQFAEAQICMHEETHRGGVLWEICDQCGAKWADDEGGKPEFKWPEETDAARAMIDAIRAHLAQPQPEPVALESVHLTRDTSGMCTVRVNGRTAVRDNGDIIDHMATLEWFAHPPTQPQGLTDADLDRIADAVPVDAIGVHITTWHRRFARAVLAAQPTPVPAVNPCGAHAVGGPCVLPAGHNMGRADVPGNHQSASPVPVPLTPYGNKYSELLMAVGKKYIGETRHQTALRYIQQAEAAHGIAASPEKP